MECPFCKKEVSKVSLAVAVGYWGMTFYKIFKNKPLTKEEQSRMNLQMTLDRYKCFLCRQKRPDAPF